MKKLAVLFPGVAYYTDMPLLYYGAKIAKKYGFEIEEVKNGQFPLGMKGSKEKMQQAVNLGVKFAEDSLKEIRFEDYDEIIFISKSIGTAIAIAFAKKHNIDAKQILYTPVEETFEYGNAIGIVVHGTSDPWAETPMVEKECDRLNLPLLLVPNTDHALEGNDVIEDIENLKRVMEFTDRYLREIK